MNTQDKENLKGLFEKFVDTEQAEKDAEDVYEGEQILCEHSAPGPGKGLIADIKAKVGKTVLHRKTDAVKRTAYKVVIAAAAVVLLAAVGIKLFEKGGGEPEGAITASIIPAVIWESDDITADDANLATLAAEIEQVERETLALQLGEDGGNGHRAVAELEMELIEINSDFWKG